MGRMICQKCQAGNAEGQKFCGQCGEALAPAVAPVPVPGEEGAYYCARHPKAVTRLRCGRCEAPICPRCTVHTPAGTRCRACAKNKVAARPMGVLHAAGRVVADGTQTAGRRVWYLALWYLILSLFRNPGEW